MHLSISTSRNWGHNCSVSARTRQRSLRFQNPAAFCHNKHTQNPSSAVGWAGPTVITAVLFWEGEKKKEKKPGGEQRWHSQPCPWALQPLLPKWRPGGSGRSPWHCRAASHPGITAAISSSSAWRTDALLNSGRRGNVPGVLLFSEPFETSWWWSDTVTLWIFTVWTLAISLRRDGRWWTRRPAASSYPEKKPGVRPQTAISVLAALFWVKCLPLKQHREENICFHCFAMPSKNNSQMKNCGRPTSRRTVGVQEETGTLKSPPFLPLSL